MVAVIPLLALKLDVAATRIELIFREQIQRKRLRVSGVTAIFAVNSFYIFLAGALII